jgi:hypothetical protein
MTKTLAGLAGVICFGLFAPMAQAAPLGGSADASFAAGTSEIIRVHGIHSSCQWDKFGRHRSRPWGRQYCPSVNPAVPLALWIWRCADGHCGYWHRNENRWRDGWRGGPKKFNKFNGPNKFNGQNKGPWKKKH